MSITSPLLLRAVAGLAALVMMSAPDTAAGHAHVHPDQAAGDVALGGSATRLPSGLYRVVTPGGYVMTTHGADPSGPEHGSTIGPGDAERDPVCATGHVMQVLYAYPAVIETSRLAEFKEEFRAHIRRTNAVLNEAALASGATTADYRVLCDQDGEIRIDEFANPTPLPYFSNVVDAARAAGFDDPNVDYLIFYDGDFPGVCGFGELSDEEQLDVDNPNNLGGYGVVYELCWIGNTAMHENGHNQGAVLPGAPHTDGKSHCTEEKDIMCSLVPNGGRCQDAVWFDCGFDDYFDASPEPGEFLATHWNIGSRLNRYIQFGDTPPPASPGAPGGEVVREDPYAMLRFDNDHPARGASVRAYMELVYCAAPGSKIRLQRKTKGRFETVASTTLDSDCAGEVSITADFKRRTFRSLWPRQSEGYARSTSRTVTIRTQP